MMRWGSCVSQGQRRERGRRKERRKKEKEKGVKMVEGLKIDDPRILVSLPTTGARGKDEDDSKHTLSFSYQLGIDSTPLHLETGPHAMCTRRIPSAWARSMSSGLEKKISKIIFLAQFPCAHHSWNGGMITQKEKQKKRVLWKSWTYSPKVFFSLVSIQLSKGGYMVHFSSSKGFKPSQCSSMQRTR